jgi:hypothetical protein
MALEVVQSTPGWFDVRGVVADATVTAPLGQRVFDLGPHRVGLDQRFVDPVLRAYYDPAADPRYVAAALDHVGYVQVAQLVYGGTPVPPDVFGGRIADRMPYADAQQRFVDFMGPADALLRGLDQRTPFYAYNASLSDGDIRTTDALFAHPNVNGSLYAPLSRSAQGVADADRSAVASIVAQPSTGFVTADDVAEQLDGRDPILTLTPAPAVLAGTEAYRLVLDRLRNHPVPGTAAAGAPPLAGVSDADIVAQVVGPYVLLTLPADDCFPETLCVSETGGTVTVHLFTTYDMGDITSGAGSEVLDRIGTYLQDTGQLRNIVPPPATKLRGRQPNGGEPFLVNDAMRLRCELRYWTFAVGVGNRKRTRGYAGGVRDRMAVLSGFTWSALYRFDPDSDRLELAALREPEECPAFPLADVHAAFAAGLTPRHASDTIDVADFTAAAVRRDSFGTGAGVAVPYVNAAHVDTTTGADLDGMDLG